MLFKHQVKSRRDVFNDAEVNLKEVVMGLHWDPAPGSGAGQPADLDAWCVLFDSQNRVLEVVHPGHPRSAADGVIHTGDSRTGASSWDDERIFVFLDALPRAVSTVAFLVRSASGHPFHEVPGALCHVSDRVTETEWVRIELSSLIGRTIHIVATLRRGDAGWDVAADAKANGSQLLAEVQQLAEYPKSDIARLASRSRRQSS